MAGKVKAFFYHLFRERDLITRNFYLVIFLFVIIVFCLVALDRFQAYALNAARAYVAGEGFWSKSQKDAVYYLERYAETFDNKAYDEYLNFLSVPLGDRKARLALQSDPPDIERARQGFLQGRNHPDDVDEMIDLFLNFGEFSYMKKAISIWTEGDRMIDELLRLGTAIHTEVNRIHPDRQHLQRLLNNVNRLNHDISKVETRFSATLGDAARKIKELTGLVMLGATLFLLAIGVILSRQILKGIRETQKELRQLETYMQEHQKMEAIGTLVGGIAHDFNNTLAAIQGNLYLAERHVKEGSFKVGSRVDEKLQSIKELSHHSAEIVRQLMTFARKDIVRMKTISLNEFMREIETLIPSIIPENIRFNLKQSSDELWINADSTQLHQIMLNLLSNARDAVEDVGTPKIEVQVTQHESNSILYREMPGSPEGMLVHIVVRDNGCGIPHENMEHIFEPFYTTKDVNKGTGLGLSMVYGSMQSHQGVVEIESEAGKGTSVHLYFPLVKHREEKADKKHARQKADKSEAMTILLVDDDVNLRTVCQEVLKSMGHKVLIARDGGSALECFNQHREEIELVITDIVMPVMGGFELAAQLRQFNENLPFIFMTGYDPKHTDIPEELLRNSTMLHKPFYMSALEKALLQMQNGAPE